MRDHGRAVLAADVEHQPVAGDRQMQRVRAALVADRREMILLDQIVDRDRALVLDIRTGTADRFLVQGHRDEALLHRMERVVGGRRHLRVAAGSPRSGHGRPDLRPCPSAIAAGPERAQLIRPAFQHRGALHEVEHAEAGRKPRRARRRQHMVGAADVIADRLRRMGAEENRAGIADAVDRLSASAVAISRCSGARRIDQRDRLVELGDQ